MDEKQNDNQSDKPAEYSLKDFEKHLRDTNPELLNSVGIAALYEACSRVLVLEEFKRWRRSVGLITEA